MANATKYILYLRKSSDSEDRQVQSIPDQKRELKPLVSEMGLKVVRTFGESKSAKQPGRSDYNEMIKMIKETKADGIVCWKLNRLARNPVDGGEIQWLLQQGIIKSIVTPGREYLPTDNVLMMAVELGMANQYVLDLSKDVKRGLRQKAERGILPTGNKPGYIFDPIAEKGQKEAIKDPVRFEIVKRAIEMVAEGTHTPAQVLDKLNDEWGYRSLQFKRRGGKPMAKSTFYRLLSDSFYYGEFEFPTGSGHWHTGVHEPMISREQFDKIQILLGRRDRQKQRKHSLPFTGGLMRCGECGAAITAEKKWQVRCTHCKYKFSALNRTACPKCSLLIENMKNPVVRHYTYYRCTRRKNPNCTQAGVETGTLEEQVDNFLSKIDVSPRFQTWIIGKLNEEHEREVASRNHIVISQQSAYNNCLKRIDNLTALKISPQNSNGELLSDEEFLERKRELLKERDALKERMATTDSRVDEWLNVAERMFNFGRYARYWFKNGTADDKRVILRTLGSNLTLFEQIFNVKAPSLFLEVKTVRELEPSVTPMFEPTKSGEIRREEADLETLWDRSPYVRARRESNPLPSP